MFTSHKNQISLCLQSLKNAVKIATLATLLSVSFTSSAQQPTLDKQAVVANTKQALDKLVWRFGDHNEHWSFQVESILQTLHGKSQRLQRFDIDKEPAKQWTLLEQDNKTPPAGLIKEYNEIQRSNAQEESQATKSNAKDTFMDASSLKFKAIEGDSLVLSFQPKVDLLNEKQNRKLTGKLFVNKDTQLITKLLIVNTDEISVSAGSSIDELELKVDFIQHSSGFTVPDVWIYNTKGTAFVFSDFEEKNSKKYSQIKRVE